MVVDEDADTIKILSKALETQGYHVVTAQNSKEGMEKAIETRPDIVIVNSILSEQTKLVETLRFERDMEHVFFLIFE